jgi:hypothetical protein
MKNSEEKLPQENNTLFVYFFHSVEVCCTIFNNIPIIAAKWLQLERRNNRM